MSRRTDHIILNALFRSAGHPHTREAQSDEPAMCPVLSLAEHTPALPDNSGSGSLSVPFYYEGDDGIGLLNIKFHKGTTFIHVIEYPDAPEHIRAAVEAFLSEREREPR